MGKARKLLDKVINLIEKDLSFIALQAEDGKLASESSMDLARYSTALLAITKDRDIEKEETKKELQKMSNADLIRLAQEAAKELDGR